MKKVVILAAHDDGVGAHTTTCRLRDGILAALQKRGLEDEFLFLYLNEGAAGRSFLRAYWDRGDPAKWTFQPDPVDPRKQPPTVNGVWQKCRNYLCFQKANDGSLDAPGTRRALRDTRSGYAYWGFQLQNVKAADVVLAIEMGVPQLTEWAAKHNIPRIAFGDTFWSRTLMGSLKGAGEYDYETEDFIHDLVQKERQTQEAWLIPLLAPRSYAEFLSEMRVTYHFLPGFIGSPPSASEVDQARISLALTPDSKLIIMAAGQTDVWRGIYERLATAFKSRASEQVALAYPDGKNITLVEHGNVRTIPNPSNLVSLFANAHLGVTRGGVTIPEFISVRLPFAVVQEPNHWLSQSQQAAAAEEGLCYTAGLSVFDDPTEAARLLLQWVRDATTNQVMQRRYELFEFGIEGKLADHLVQRFF